MKWAAVSWMNEKNDRKGRHFMRQPIQALSEFNVLCAQYARQDVWTHWYLKYSVKIKSCECHQRELKFACYWSKCENHATYEMYGFESEHSLGQKYSNESNFKWSTKSDDDDERCKPWWTFVQVPCVERITKHIFGMDTRKKTSKWHFRLI